MIVVSDTGPLNYLVLIGRIELLPSLFGEVVVPSAVYRELLDAGAPTEVREWARRLPGWISLRDPQIGFSGGEIGRGEVAAIAIAQELGARLLFDDGPARNAARRAGLSVSGTLGVLQLAHARSLLAIRDALADLERTNFHRDKGHFESVVEDAESMRNEVLKRASGVDQVRG